MTKCQAGDPRTSANVSQELAMHHSTHGKQKQCRLKPSAPTPGSRKTRAEALSMHRSPTSLAEVLIGSLERSPFKIYFSDNWFFSTISICRPRRLLLLSLRTQHGGYTCNFDFWHRKPWSGVYVQQIASNNEFFVAPEGQRDGRSLLSSDLRRVDSATTHDAPLDSRKTKWASLKAKCSDSPQQKTRSTLLQLCTGILRAQRKFFSGVWRDLHSKT